MTQPQTEIERKMQDETGVLAALSDAREAALRRHAHAGVPIVVWRDGKVIELPSDVALAEHLRHKQSKQGGAAA